MDPGLIILLLLLVPFTSYFGNQARYINDDVSCALSEFFKDRQRRAVVKADLSAELMDSEELSVELRRATGELSFLLANSR
ncbi:hypothetical protein Y032_0031g2349 [Ancylostoma ceylanicum]|uniref:Uncharacterized protein n=1 Tax=Ancylostoma ceylanicum TaxID=53326 RepID=A0A016UPA8_9BILA|nr:hypothetical protein Y032_0031g2349 [Ancylostoma ceylanicum]